MPGPLLVTKLYIPPLRSELVPRPRLVTRLNQGLGSGDPADGSFARKLTLVSAPAGFGKTTLLSEWLHSRRETTPSLQAAWLSLDPGDNDPARFLAYVVAALQGLKLGLGEAVLSAYCSPQPPPTEALLTALINELADLPAPAVLNVSLRSSPASNRSIRRGRDTNSERMGGIWSFVSKREPVTSSS
jgi:LuxR family maltose regulon positive regulatory protein